MANVVFGVDRLHPFILRKVNSTLDRDGVILDARLDADAIDTRHFKHDGQRIGSFENICHRYEYPSRRRTLGFLLDFALLLDPPKSLRRMLQISEGITA